MLTRLLVFSAAIAAISTSMPSSATAQTSAPKIAGYMKTNFIDAPARPGAVKVANVRLRMSGSVDETTDYTFFIDAVRDDVLLDACITRTFRSSITITVGQFKTPYSTDNLMAGWRYPFINRGYINSAVTPLFRDIGVQVAHRTALVDVFAAVMNGSGANKAETNANKATTCRIAAHPVSWIGVSGNYSGGRITADGAMTDFYDVGIDGLAGAFRYAGEYGCKKHRGVCTCVVCGWASYDWATDIAALPVLVPAVKIEHYEPDTDVPGDVIDCYTVGIALHFAQKHADRIMLNYEMRDTEADGTDETIGIEYLVRY